MVRKEPFKTYVLDTTVLIGDPDIFCKIAGEVIIPFVVLRELDGLKNCDHVDIARAARKVSRTLDRVGSYNDLTKKGKLSTGAVLKIVNAFDPVDALASDADNKVVGTALRLKREGAENVVLVSTDSNMRIVARAMGLKTEYWPDEEEKAKAGSCSRSVGTSQYQKPIIASERGSFSVNFPPEEKYPWGLAIKIIICGLLVIAGIALVGDKETENMASWFTVIMIFAGFFFLVVRPLQQRSRRYDVELPKQIGPYFPTPDSEVRRQYDDISFR
jgi:PIN domain